MSCDFGVWFPHRRLSNAEASALYAALCDGDTSGVRPHPGVEAFYKDLTAAHPEIDTIPEDRIDDDDYCPWSCALDHSDAHVIMPCVWSQAENVTRLVHELAAKHDLAVYDPQANVITYPRGSPVSHRPWWRFW